MGRLGRGVGVVKAITLHQPWATLVALGVKTIETRSWATKYRGPLAIHAGTTRPDQMHLPPLSRGRGPEADRHNRQTWLVIDTITDPAFQGPRRQGSRVPKRATTPTLFFPHEGPHGRPWDRSLGTSSTEQGSAVYLPLGAVVATCTLVEVVPTAEAQFVADDALVGEPNWSLVDHSWRNAGGDFLVREQERPYGDYSAGRFAWVLDEIKPVDPPAPARGYQGAWEWTP